MRQFLVGKSHSDVVISITFHLVIVILFIRATSSRRDDTYKDLSRLELMSDPEGVECYLDLIFYTCRMPSASTHIYFFSTMFCQLKISEALFSDCVFNIRFAKTFFPSLEMSKTFV